MSDVIQIFDKSSDEEVTNSANAEFTMESVRSMVKQMNEIDEGIKGLREDRKSLIQDFIDEYNIPKKEVAVAIRMLRGDVDPEITSDIYSNIADLID
jgi:hypothetical protein